MDIKEEVMDVKLEDNDLPYYDIPDLVDQNLLKTLTPDENVYPADATIYYPSKNLSDIQTVEFTNTEDENHAQTIVASDDELELPKGKTYRCSICGYIALYNSILTQHKAKHSVKEKQQSFACAHCNNKYRTDNDLQDHIDTCHSDSRPKKVVHQQFYRCSLCGYQTPRKSSYIQHKVAHMALEERQLFACSQCNKKYTSITGLRYHIDTCHINSRSQKKLYTCYTPYESRYRRYNRRYPVATHLQPGERHLFACGHCNIKYTSIHSLQRHITHIHGESRNVSSINEVESEDFLKVNPDDDAPKQDEDLHNDFKAKEIQETYTCSTCGIITPYESVYRQHMTSHLSPEERQLFTYAHCNKEYTLKRSLKRHLNPNHNEARAKEIQETYTCSTCGIITPYESVYRQHMTSHLSPEERQLFTYAHCNKEYTLKRSLKRHLNPNHNEARAKEIQETYTCSTCGIITPYESVYRRHMTRHLPPEKRQLFTCAYCNKQYTLKRSLNRHLNNNHNEARAKEIQETYTCSTCEFITLSESVCRRHMTRHLLPKERQLFTCAYCNKQYTLKKSLKRHLNNNHNEARNAAHVPVTNEEEPEEFLNVEPDNDAPKFDEDMHDEFKITDQEEVKLENVIKMEPSYDSSFLNWKMKIGKFY